MISNLAQIHSSAKIAKGVKIGAFAIIGENVEIDEGTEVKPHAFIKGPCSIGKNNSIYQFASIGDDPQDLKFSGEDSRLEIGDNNVFREYCSINRGTKHGNLVTKIGNDNLFITYSHVAHDCTIGNNNVIGNCCALAGHVEIGDFVNLSGYTMVSQFLSIGSYVFTAMGSGIVKNLPPFMWVNENPCNLLNINKVGMLRNGFSEDEIKTVKNVFRLLRKPNLRMNELISQLEDDLPSPSLDILLSFLKKYGTSKFGVIRK